MKPDAEIHKGKQPVRRHYIREWLEARDMDPMDLVNKLNETVPYAPMIDKSQVYRWLKGQMPQPPMQARIAAALEIVDVETGEPDPSGILRHPDFDWFARKMQGRDEDEVRRLKQMVELVFPSKTGTRN